MKRGFYSRLAWTGIRKNGRLYIPYILTCIGMVMMYYIILFLSESPLLEQMSGGGTAAGVLGFGSWVMGAFALLFLFYTNSFLVRRRKKELGLYNILGMGKRNIAKILFRETLVIAGIVFLIGTVSGIALSKLAELALVNIIQGEVNYSVGVSVNALLRTLLLFSGIFLLIFLNTLRQIHASNPIALLHSENSGEKPPKANWILGALGALLLAAAYYLAVSIEDPITALAVFFAAVIMVIAGTYLLFIAASVVFCRILQKNKNYYYKPNHFVSVSSMAYRMKRNGAGLASICILGTMVLVMISSTGALYFGSEDSINRRYPKDINMDFQFEDTADLSDENIGVLRNDILSIAGRCGAEPDSPYDYRSASIAGLLEGGIVETDVSKVNQFEMDTYSNVFQFHIIPLADYNAVMGTNETLRENEVLIYTYRADYEEQTIAFKGGNSFHIKKQVDEFFNSGETAMNIIPTIAIIVSDFEAAVQGIDAPADYSGNKMLQLRWTYDFNTGLEGEQENALFEELKSAFREFEINGERNYDSSCFESREANRSDYYGTFGGLFFLGILLSLVFIAAAVLIIYYKQVSEGYEDQSRFEIMQKVGMTKRDIRKSINSQLLTVFFLPLVMAGVHLAFAFPMVQKLLLLFNLTNLKLFALVTVISFLIFALCYMLVYRITSNAYYNIVSGAKAE